MSNKTNRSQRNAIKSKENDSAHIPPGIVRKILHKTTRTKTTGE